MFKALIEGLLGLAFILMSANYVKEQAEKFIIEEAIPTINRGLSPLNKFTKALTKIDYPTLLDDPETFKEYVEGGEDE